MLLRDIIVTAASRARVCEVADGQGALDYLRRLGPDGDHPRPDLIYLDIEMPGLNGQEVLKAIRADRALREIPVVMLTGLDDEKEKRRALENGAAGYVVKPTEPRRFLSVVSRSVDRWIRRQGRAGRPEPPGPDGENDKDE